MKLYLSSYRVPTPTDLFALVGKAPEVTKVAIIPNAKDYKQPAEYQESLEELTQYLTELKVGFEVVDLRLFEVPSVLKERLSEFDLIWASGGNTFLLRYQMRRSGFEAIIQDLLKDGKVYGGESAGAIVAGTSLHGIQAFDDPAQAPELIWEGMRLVDKMFLPHADSPDFGGGMEALLEQYPDEDKRIVLNDNQAWVLNEEVENIVTAP